MRLDWSPLADLLARLDRFVVTTHVRPDGDALGSEVGLADLLRRRGKDVRVVNASPTPPRYRFLDPDGTLFEHFGHGASAESLADRQGVIILDLSSWGQLGDMADFVRGFGGPRLVIDHHVSEDDLGATMLKDTTAEATGTLVLDAHRALGLSPTPAAAAGLFTAIAMDTGWFRHPSTRPSTFRDAAELVEAGAPVNAIDRALNEQNTPGRLLLHGRALASLRTELDGRIAYTTVTRADLDATGAVPQDTEDFVDDTVSLVGVEVGILFIEQRRGGVKASLRSRGAVDVARLAARFGGGGHRAAAGALLPEPTDRAVESMLAAVREELKRLTAENAEDAEKREENRDSG